MKMKVDIPWYEEAKSENGTWKERYECSGIEIHEEEVKFRTDLVPSVTIPFPRKFKGKTEIPSIFSSTLSNQKR